MSVDLYLARALASVVASIQLSNDEDVDPDVANKLLEPVGAILQEMESGDREQLTRLVQVCAEAETNPDRRQIIEALPEAFGLLDA